MIQPLRHIYNSPDLDRDYLIYKLVTLKVKGLISIEEYEYLNI